MKHIQIRIYSALFGHVQKDITVNDVMSHVPKSEYHFQIWRVDSNLDSLYRSEYDIQIRIYSGACVHAQQTGRYPNLNIYGSLRLKH